MKGELAFALTESYQKWKRMLPSAQKLARNAFVPVALFPMISPRTDLIKNIFTTYNPSPHWRYAINLHSASTLIPHAQENAPIVYNNIQKKNVTKNAKK